MTVQHKNSKEVFDLSIPCYTKMYGRYGYLVQGGGGVFFIYEGECDCVSTNFNKL